MKRFLFLAFVIFCSTLISNHKAEHKHVLAERQVLAAQVIKSQKLIAQVKADKLERLALAKAAADKKTADDAKAAADAEAAKQAALAAIVPSAPAVGGFGGSFSAPAGSVAPDSAGNTYAFGNCTWYVKNRRPSISNSWGNANTWFYNAGAQGWATGTAPRVGAIGTTTAGGLGHVVYIEAVNGDGTVTLSEMNYDGFDLIDTRVAAASDFLYIY
jgi:surface antigen